MIGLHLYTSNIPKWTYPRLNHIGVSVSDQTLQHQLTMAVDIIQDKLHTLAISGNAFITIFDNLNKTSTVHDI